MRNNNYLKKLTGLALCITLTGCAALESAVAPPKRQVQSNTLSSSRYPNGVITVDQELEYLGMVPVSEWQKYSSDPGGSYRNRDTYIFASKDVGDFMDRVVTINLWTINHGYWIPGFEKNDFIQVDKYVKGDQRFDTGVFYTTIARDDETSVYIEDSGYLLPSCMVFKSYQKVFSPERNSKNKMTISYGEPISCERVIMFLSENTNTERTQKFLAEFNKNADTSFQSVSF